MYFPTQFLAEVSFIPPPANISLLHILAWIWYEGLEPTDVDLALPELTQSKGTSGTQRSNYHQV